MRYGMVIKTPALCAEKGRAIFKKERRKAV
nr:MAG TPA: hypothetical protein [Caudoviricetes sp.]